MQWMEPQITGPSVCVVFTVPDRLYSLLKKLCVLKEGSIMYKRSFLRNLIAGLRSNNRALVSPATDQFEEDLS
jgi:hypothetical protein